MGQSFAAEIYISQNQYAVENLTKPMAAAFTVCININKHKCWILLSAQYQNFLSAGLNLKHLAGYITFIWRKTNSKDLPGGDGIFQEHIEHLS